MTMINLTPHPICLRNANLDMTVVPPSGTVARVTSTAGALVVVEGVPVPVAEPDTFGEVIDLPSPVEGTFFIVSALVGAALVGKGRRDVLMPGTGPADDAVRSAEGRILAVTRLKRIG